MKKLLLALLILPLLAGCWWNKKIDVIETTSATSAHQESNLEKFEHLMGEAEEDDEYLERPVNGEIQDK